jgi:hypothetical protein
MTGLRTILAGLLFAAVLSAPCSAQYAAPASIAPSLIQYSTPQPQQPGYFVSHLVLYNADLTYTEINSSATSAFRNETYATRSGTFTYFIDPQNVSHGTIVYDGGTGPLPNDALYFTTSNSGAGTPPGGSVADGGGPQLFWWSPMQNTNGGVNVSNRCQLNSGGAAISGFVVQSTSTGYDGPGTLFLNDGLVEQSTGPRWVLLRAAGTTLGSFGVSGVVSKPSFRLYDSTQSVIGTSTVWSADPNLISGYSTIFSLTGAFPLNAGSDEGILLIQLPAGAYTAVFSAANAGTILCEVYILPF